MTTERETLRIIGSWMEDGRTRLPEHVLDAVLDQLPSTPQRRPGWSARRITQVNALSKYAIAAAAVVIVAFVGLTLLRSPAIGPAASPSPTASPSPVAPPPLTGRFDSTLNLISMSYPVGWQTRPATKPWERGAIAFGAPEVDVIFDPTLQDDLFLAVVSEPLDGQLPGDWCCSPQIQGPDICYEGGGGGGGGGSYRLDGAEDGFAATMGCGRDGTRHSIVAATAARGYIIQLYAGDKRLAETYDWDWFEALLETVDLRPVDAP